MTAGAAKPPPGRPATPPAAGPAGPPPDRARPPSPPAGSPPAPGAAALARAPAWHRLGDEELLRQCEVQVHRAGGPGGQHRNKVETAIRLVHGPSGVVAEGKSQRSRTQNLSDALERLREKLAQKAYRPPPRKKTKPSRGAKVRRLESKRRQGEKKAQRRGEL